MGSNYRPSTLALETGSADILLDVAPADETPRQSPARAKSWKLILVGLNLSAMLSGVAIAAFLWLMALPPTPDCDRLTRLAADMERIYCAEAAAQSGELVHILAGLDMLGTWTPDRPLYHAAQQHIDQWSNELLNRAQQKMTDGDMAAAMRLVGQIPETSPAHAEAQSIVAEWEDTWRRGESIAAQAQAAMQAQNWAEASAQILRLQSIPHDFWRSHKITTLSQQAWQERRGRKLQQDALKQAQAGDLAEAIALGSDIAPGTFAQQDLQPLLDQWSQTLLAEGRQRWLDGDFDEALQLAEQMRPNPAFRAEADALVTLVEARRRVLSTLSAWEVSPHDIYGLEEAIAQISTVPPESQFYPQAQDSRRSWQAQATDLRTLQMAQVLANIGAIETLRAAVIQAETIAPQRFRRPQAQTLVAHWQRQIERLEDAPILAQAQALAAQGTREALQAAIDRASQIPLGRALRGEAQAYVYQWNADLQRREDEPFLALARIQAGRGNLRDAIRAAQVIREDRVLYATAQQNIRQWRDRIRAAERRRQQAQAARQPQRPRSASPKPVAPAVPTESGALERSPLPATPTPSPLAPSPTAEGRIESPANPSTPPLVEPVYAPLQVDNPAPSDPENSPAPSLDNETTAEVPAAS